MDERIAFAKLCGSGNDFICIDARDGRIEKVADPAARDSVVRSLFPHLTSRIAALDGRRRQLPAPTPPPNR